MTELQKRLFAMQDKEYAAFQAKLVPTVAPERIIGIRLPLLRKFAKEYFKETESAVFLNTLPHRYYDEDMLHMLLIEQIKSLPACVEGLENFLPYVDNWAVCDTATPRAVKENREVFLPQLRLWAQSEHTYTCRFALKQLMACYLDNAFLPEYLEIPAAVLSEEYYVNMMIAWFFATALAKQWDAAIPYLQNRRLAPWIHNKTIQKAVESYRITKEQKDYLRTLKV